MTRNGATPSGRLPGARQEMQTTASGFALGFASLFRGFRLVYVDRRDLARFYLPPMVLALLFLIAGLVAFGMTVDEVVNWWWAEPDLDAWYGIKHFLWKVMAILLWIVVALITVILTVVIFSLFAAPFSDVISEQVEGHLGSWTPRPFSFQFMMKDLGQTIMLELRRVGIKAAWLLPLFVLSLILPVVGHIIYVVLGGYLLSKFTGMDYVDWCAARRGWSWRKRLDFAKTHRFALTGLGTAVVLSLMIPLMFAIVWPAAVAGGAILFNALNNESET